MGIVLPDGTIEVLNNMSPAASLGQLGTNLDMAINNLKTLMNVDIFYVNGAVSASGDGKSWAKAVKTIQEGLNLARYLPGTTTLDYSKNRHAFVFVAPGQYNEQVLFSGYNIHLIGLTYKLGNVDYGVVINKNAAVTTTCVFGFTGGGIEIAGIQIHNEAAIPTLWSPTPGDGCWIHDCVIDGDDTNATYGIEIVDCRNMLIENNRLFNFVTAAIKVGHTGKYFRNSQVRWNHIAGSQGIGILVPLGVTCAAGYGSIIAHNYIIGTCLVGIHQQEAGAFVLVADNWVQATTAVTDAGTGAADNHAAS